MHSGQCCGCPTNRHFGNEPCWLAEYAGQGDTGDAPSEAHRVLRSHLLQTSSQRSRAEVALVAWAPSVIISPLATAPKGTCLLSVSAF